MNEATFWRDVVRPLLTRATRGHRFSVERVENSVASGTPDVDYCLDGTPGKIELKWSSRLRASPEAMVLGSKNGLRRSQVVWIHRRLHAGGRVLIVVGCPGYLWVVDARSLTKEQMYALGTYGRAQLDAVCSWAKHLGGDIPSILGVLTR